MSNVALRRNLIAPPPERVAWVDYAKGWCIILVVMMHSTLGYGEAIGGEGWLHAVVAFAKPFRMPDFFLISGLFLARVIDRDLWTFLDRKVVHFAYFYVLWLVIQLSARHAGLVVSDPAGFGTLIARGLVEPLGTLWFIHLLPVMFLVTRALRRVDWRLVLAAAAMLQIAPIATGWTAIDEFVERYVYFFAGYALAGPIFAFAARVAAEPGRASRWLFAWACVNGVAVLAGVADAPVVALLLGFLGAAAVVATSALLARGDVAPLLRLCGERSLPIYLAFFLFMAAARAALVKTGAIPDIGLASLAITAAGVVGPLLLYALARRTPARILFERPAWAGLPACKPTYARLAPAE